MLKSMAVFTALATVGLGFIGDSKKTALGLLSIVTIRGASFASTKIADALDPKMSQVIDFTAWCLCAGSMVSIIKIGFTAVTPFVNFVTSVVNGISEVVKFLASIG